MSLELPALRRKSSRGLFQMQWGSHVPILAVLALMFVIPHDPSASTLDPRRIGSAAFSFGGRTLGRARQQRSSSTSEVRCSPPPHLPGSHAPPTARA